MSARLIATFPELLAVLAEQNVPHTINADARSVEIPARNPPLDSVCYIRWEKELPFVQVICPLVSAVPVERHVELRAAICRVNNAIPLPGFGLDPERGTLYFRHTLGIAECISPGTFQLMVLAVMNAARDYLVPFRGVIDGKRGDEILAAVVAHAAAAHAARAAAAFQD